MSKIIELFKYGFWGGVSTLFNLALFYFMARCGINYILANILSYFLAVIVSYFLNDKLVFKAQRDGSPRKKLIIFVLIRMISVCADSALLYLCVTVLMQDMLISKLCISGSMILGTYVFNKLFVFTSQGEREKK